MQINLSKNQKNYLILALAFSIILSVELTIMGFTNYSSVAKVGGAIKHVDFPESSTRLIINLSYVVLIGIYLLWLGQSKNVNYISSKFLVVIRIFIIIAFVTYPYSSDVYLYLHYGLMDLHQINPFINPASSFSSSLSPFLAWSQTSTYGPVSQVFFTLAAKAVSVSPILGVYIFKIFCVFFHVINGYLIWLLLKNFSARDKLTIAYLINPFILVEHVSNAHVDVFICTAFLTLIYCLYRYYYVAAILAIWVGFLAKTIPLLWFPFAFIYLVKQRVWKSLLISLIISVVIIFVLDITCLPTLAAWKSLLNPGTQGKVAKSLHHLLSLSLNLTSLSFQQKQHIVSFYTYITYLGFIIYYFWTLLQSYWRQYYLKDNLISDIGWITLVLFLFATPWVMPWYPSILLPMAAISNSRLLVLTSLTYSISNSLVFGSGAGNSSLSIVTVIIALAPPLTILLLRSKFLDQISQPIPLLGPKFLDRNDERIPLVNTSHRL